MRKDPRVNLAQILESIQRIEQFTADGRDRFLRDAMVQAAVLRNFSIIAEAAGRLDDRYRSDHPEIPWTVLAGPRSVLLTQDEGIDPERVWAIVELDLPGLLEAIAALLPPLDQLERELGGDEDVTGQGL